MEENQDSKHEQLTDYLWLIRPCDNYHEEYKECCRWRARLFQKYVHGEGIDCEQWKIDRNNCVRWEAAHDYSAASAIIESEKQRRTERLLPHVKNKVWEKREKPPEDWNKPLPQFMEKTKHSYITTRMRVEKDGLFSDIEEMKKSYCSIQ